MEKHEATTPMGQLTPGAHPVPSEPVSGVRALSEGAIASGSFPYEHRACLS